MSETTQQETQVDFMKKVIELQSSDDADSSKHEIDYNAPWRMGEDVFKGVRLINDPNIVDNICQILKRCGHPNPTQWADSEMIKYAHEIPPEGQLFLVNRYFRIELGKLEEDTMLQRRALLDIVASYADYFSNFEIAVAPVLVRTYKQANPTEEDCSNIKNDSVQSEPID